MEKLSVCRVCLEDDVRLNPKVESHIQEMYESLTKALFETEDNRPILVCYICRARLQNCYELRRSCLQSEELFTQMLSCDELKQYKMQENYKKRLSQVHNVVCLSIGQDVLQTNTDAKEVKIEQCDHMIDAGKVDMELLPLNHVKVEQIHSEDIIEDALEENSVYDNSEAADSDDNPLIVVKEEQSRDSTSEVSPMYSEQAVQTSSDLKQHQLVQHKFKEVNKVTTLTEENRLCCDICNKQFSQRGHLTVHRRTHTGEKPYHCDVCNKEFTQKQHLTEHIRTHTGEKPHCCNLCQKGFSRKYDLSVHMRTHTGEKPYSCRICKKQYFHKSHLTVHIRTHTGEKPFSCNICEKQFLQKQHLTTHMRTHTGEKPYTCDICNKHFTKSGHLNVHMRKH